MANRVVDSVIRQRTVHRHTLDRATGEYEPDPAGPQPVTWLLTTAPDIS
jgi:hypothetical protein